MKYYLPLLLLSLVLWACSNSDNPEPVVPIDPPSFADANAVIDVYPNNWYPVDVLNFDNTKHQLKLNGVNLETTNADETHPKVTVKIPSKVGSGRIELHDGTTVTSGPQVNYYQRYLYLSLTNHILGASMCGYKDNKIIIWDPLSRSFNVMRFIGFSQNGDVTSSFGMKNYPVTYASTNGVTVRYNFNGITTSPSGDVTFYRLFTGAGGGYQHRILTTSDLSTSTDFSGGIATDMISTVFDLEQDSKGNLYTVETSRLYIQKIYQGGVDHGFAGSEKAGDADGKSIDASFRRIRAITIDSKDNIYVADSSRVRMITPAGIVTTLAGSIEPGDKDGSVSEARFGSLFGISIAPSGELYLYDSKNGKFKVISADRKTVRTLMVINNPSLAPHAKDANAPLYVDANGNIFYMRNDWQLHVLMPEDNAPANVVSRLSETSVFAGGEVILE